MGKNKPCTSINYVFKKLLEEILSMTDEEIKSWRRVRFKKTELEKDRYNFLCCRSYSARIPKRLDSFLEIESLLGGWRRSFNGLESWFEIRVSEAMTLHGKTKFPLYSS